MAFLSPSFIPMPHTAVDTSGDTNAVYAAMPEEPIGLAAIVKLAGLGHGRTVAAIGVLRAQRRIVDVAAYAYRRT